MTNEREAAFALSECFRERNAAIAIAQVLYRFDAAGKKEVLRLLREEFGVRHGVSPEEVDRLVSAPCESNHDVE